MRIREVFQGMVLALVLGLGIGGAVRFHHGQMRVLAARERRRRAAAGDAAVLWQVDRRVDEYRSRIRSLHAETLSQGEAGLGRLFGQGRAAAPGCLQELCSAGCCARMMGRLVRDRISGTDEFGGFAAARIAPVVLPYEEAAALCDDRLRTFARRLEELRLRLLADLALPGRPAESAAVPGVPQAGGLVGGMAEVVSRAQSGKVAAAVAVSLEGIFLRETRRDLQRLLAAILARAGRTAGTAGGCAAADGPLAIGDAVGIGLTLWGLGSTFQEVRQAQRRLPRQLRSRMDQALATEEERIRRRLREEAGDLAGRYRRLGDEILRRLHRRLEEDVPQCD